MSQLLLILLHELQRIVALVGASYVYVGWNLRDARFGDPAVRRAAAMAVDVPRLCRTLCAGQADPTRGPLVPALGIPDTTQLLPHDVRAARALLQSAGWADLDGDGVRERHGSRLAFNLLVPENDPLRVEAAAAVAAALQPVGMQVDVRRLAAEEFGARLQNASFEAYVGQWFPTVGPHLEDVWHSDATDRLNYGGFASSAVDSILLAPVMLNYEFSCDLHVDFRTLIYAPTGDYEVGRLANTSKNFWTFGPILGLLYFGEKNGFEACVYTGFDFNTENSDTDYHSGTQFHVDGTPAQHFPLFGGLAGVGVSGFWYQQITGDIGAGATFGDFIGHTAGLGPAISYAHKVAGRDMVLELKWLRECDTPRGLEGDYLWLKAIFKF